MAVSLDGVLIPMEGTNKEQTRQMYSDVRVSGKGYRAYIETIIKPRTNSKARCSVCERPCPGYDVPLWAIAVFFVYAPRRVQCPERGVIVALMPWSNGKSPMTTALMCFLADWAKRLSWWETAKRFGTSWDKVRLAVQWVVHWGLEHCNLDGIDSLGIDEIAYGKGHKYMSLVYDISAGCKRLLWLGEKRTKATIKQFFTWFGSRPLRQGPLRVLGHVEGVYRRLAALLPRLIAHP